MESSLRKSVHGGKMKEEIMEVDSTDDEGSNKEDRVLIKEDLLAKIEEEMREMIEENQTLRTNLDRMMKDYQLLQMKFQDVLQQQTTTKSTTSSTPINTKEPHHHDLVSLILGRTSSIDMNKTSTPNKDKEIDHQVDRGKEPGRTLGLDCIFETKYNKQILGESSIMSPEKNILQVKEEAVETWQSQKSLKRNVEDEISSQNPSKRARVSVRVRCDSSTMNDGCQWRKYGQKTAKGNPCPRAYYRCTVAPNCPVRKQVQRCAEDMTILITTYEGTHNHTLPEAATAIVSTTAAAARMLLSASSTSSPTANISNLYSTIPSTNINGLNYYFSADNSKSMPFHFPNSSSSSSSPSSFPTVTLDLTSTSSSSSLSPFTRITSSSPIYPSTNLNFCSSETSNSWSNGVLNYGASSSFNFQRQENIHQNYPSKNMSFTPQATLAEATKAITSDPPFQSALVVALSSIIGSTRSTLGGLVDNNKAPTPPSQHLKIGDQSFPILSSFAPIGNNSQSGTVFSLHSSSSCPISKSKSASPDDKKDHTL